MRGKHKQPHPWRKASYKVETARRTYSRSLPTYEGESRPTFVQKNTKTSNAN